MGPGPSAVRASRGLAGATAARRPRLAGSPGRCAAGGARIRSGHGGQRGGRKTGKRRADPLTVRTRCLGDGRPPLAGRHPAVCAPPPRPALRVRQRGVPSGDPKPLSPKYPPSRREGAAKEVLLVHRRGAQDTGGVGSAAAPVHLEPQPAWHLPAFSGTASTPHLSREAHACPSLYVVVTRCQACRAHQPANQTGRVHRPAQAGRPAAAYERWPRIACETETRARTQWHSTRRFPEPGIPR